MLPDISTDAHHRPTQGDALAAKESNSKLTFIASTADKRITAYLPMKVGSSKHNVDRLLSHMQLLIAISYSKEFSSSYLNLELLQICNYKVSCRIGLL